MIISPLRSLLCLAAWAIFKHLVRILLRAKHHAALEPLVVGGEQGGDGEHKHGGLRSLG